MAMRILDLVVIVCALLWLATKFGGWFSLMMPLAVLGIWLILKGLRWL